MIESPNLEAGAATAPSGTGHERTVPRALLVAPLVALSVFVAVEAFGANLSVTAFAAVAGLVVALPADVRSDVGSMASRLPARLGAVLHGSLALWVIALAGVVLRLRSFVVDRALWLDEAFLARSLLDRDLTDLISTRLAHNQSAPPGFLALVHGSVRLFGFHESSLRLPTFLASLLTLVLAVLLARKVFSSQPAALVFVTFVSLSPILIYYSQEFKQYAFDALAAVVVLLVHSADFGKQRPVLAGLALAATALVSLPGAILVTIVVALDLIRRQSITELRTRLPATGIAAFGVLLHLAYTLRSGTNRAAMVAYWQEPAFPPDGGLLVQVRWHFDKLLEFIWVALAHGNKGWSQVGVNQTWIALLLAFVFIAANALRKRTAAVEVGLMALLGFVILAQLELYPLGARLTLYMVPLLALLFAQGLEVLLTHSRTRQSALLVVLILVILLPVSVSWDRFREPIDDQDIRLAVETLNARVALGDLVVSNGFSRTAVELYRDAGIIGPEFRIEWTSDSRGSADSVGELLDEVIRADDSERSPQRVWVMASHSTRELREAAEVAATERSLRLVCELHRSGLLIALYAEDPDGLGDSMCDLGR